MLSGPQADATDTWITRSYEEIHEIAQSDGSIAVVPVASVEQHGHHLPVGTDSMLVSAVVAEANDRLDDVALLTTPPVWSGYSPHHLPFGGTISLEFEHLLAVLEDIADTALENGFDAILFVNGHGGNKALLSSAVSTIGTDHPETEVLGITYFDLAASFIDEIRDSDPGGMAHGGEFETALMLHLYPDLVKEDRMEGTPLDEPYDQGLVDLVEFGPLSVYRPFDEYSESGAIGEPELGSAEKGAEIFDRLGDELATLFRDVSERNA